MKRSKKNSDEDKVVRKKKSKSNKRRRGDSSSSSSGSEDDPGSQRRQQRRKKGSMKPEKRIKESKKSVRKKSRRSSRRWVRASPSSGRSCSTCGGSSSGSSAEGRRRQRRSRSPVARLERKWKSKSRARSGSRGRSRRRMSGPQEGMRLRSPSRSCSTCPSRSASSSSRGRSPVQSRRTEREIEKPKRFLSEEVVLRNNSDSAAEWDKNIQPGGNSASLQSKNDASEVQRKLDTHFRTSEVTNSVNVVRKNDRAKERDGKLVPEEADNRPSKKANASDDDFTKKNENPSSSVSSVADIELILRQKALENFRKFRSGASTNRASIANMTNKVSETKVVPFEVDELGQKALESHRKSQRGFADNIRSNDDMENEATETHVNPPEVIEMRQKALENFRKSQGGSLNTRLAANEEKGSDGTFSYYKLSDLVEVQNSGTAVRHRLTINEQQKTFHGDNKQSGRWMRSIVTIPETSTMKQNISNQNSSDISQTANMSLPDNSNKSQIIDKLVEIDKPSTEAPSMKTWLEEDKLHKRADTEPASHAKDNIAEAATQLISEASAPESESRDGNNVENAGSQFQEKKFSRMHDGELVQVSYKVYIPTRPPAFSRRKLQH